MFPPRNDDFDDFQFFDDGYERFDYESSDDEDEDVNEGEVGIEEHAAVLGVSVNATDEEVREAAAMAHIGEFIESLPEGW